MQALAEPTESEIMSYRPWHRIDIILVAAVCLAGILEGSVRASDQVRSDVDEGIVLQEDFDGEPLEAELSNWHLTRCQTSDAGQSCQSHKILSGPGGPPPSSPHWGIVLLRDKKRGCGGPIEVRYGRSFEVPATGPYRLQATLGTKACDICTVSTRLYVDKELVFDRRGFSREGFDPLEAVTENSTTLELEAGSHLIELGVHSDIACYGGFAAYFDDIAIVFQGSRGSDDRGSPDQLEE